MILEIIGFIIFLVVLIKIWDYLYKDEWADWKICCGLLFFLFFLLVYIAGNSLLRRILIFISILIVYILNRRSAKLPVEEEFEDNYQDNYNQNNNIPQNEIEFDNRVEPESNNRIEFEPINNIEQDDKPLKPEENIDVKKDKIDINIATQEELSSLNALNLIQSKKIIQFRNNGKYIKSYDDLRVMLNLKDYQVEQIKNETFIDEKSIPASQGRIVDL